MPANSLDFLVYIEFIDVPTCTEMNHSSSAKEVGMLKEHSGNSLRHCCELFTLEYYIFFPVLHNFPDDCSIDYVC